eukprot:14459525-Alexandrium_andersonii.AAC.1
MALLETADGGQFPNLPGMEGEMGKGKQPKSQWRSAWNQGVDDRPDRPAGGKGGAVASTKGKPGAASSLGSQTHSLPVTFAGVGGL